MPCIDGVTVSDGWIPLVEFMRPSIPWHLLYICGKKRSFICFMIGKKFIMKTKKYMFMKEVYYEEEEIYVYESLFL